MNMSWVRCVGNWRQKSSVDWCQFNWCWSIIRVFRGENTIDTGYSADLIGILRQRFSVKSCLVWPAGITLLCRKYEYWRSFTSLRRLSRLEDYEVSSFKIQVSSYTYEELFYVSSGASTLHVNWCLCQTMMSDDICMSYLLSSSCILLWIASQLTQAQTSQGKKIIMLSSKKESRKICSKVV